MMMQQDALTRRGPLTLDSALVSQVNFYCLYFPSLCNCVPAAEKGISQSASSDSLVVLRFSPGPNWLDYNIIIIVNISLSPTFEIQTKKYRGMKTLSNSSVQHWKGFLFPEWQKLPMYHPESFYTP